MIPYGRQSVNEKDIRAVEKTLRSSFLTQGPEVKRFEEKLAKISGAKYAVVVSNGTTALHAAYIAAGIVAGDEIITTPITFVSTSNMAVVLGAKPVFCDIRMDTYNINEEMIESLITKKTKAIVPVHLAGEPAEMNVILRIAKKYELIVIEDGCHALGSFYRGKSVGSIGDMTVMSFHPVKSITTGEGGAILTNNQKTYERLLSIRSHGIHKDKDGFNVMMEMGYNYRITDIQCALGNSQLNRLPTFIKKRKKVVDQYNKLLFSNKNIVLPTPQKESLSAWHIYVIRTVNKKDRLPLYKSLKEKGIGVNLHYPAVYSHPFYRKNGYANFKLPNADLYHETAITLPLFPGLSVKEIKFITSSINEYFHD